MLNNIQNMQQHLIVMMNNSDPIVTTVNNLTKYDHLTALVSVCFILCGYLFLFFVLKHFEGVPDQNQQQGSGSGGGNSSGGSHSNGGRDSSGDDGDRFSPYSGGKHPDHGEEDDDDDIGDYQEDDFDSSNNNNLESEALRDVEAIEEAKMRLQDAEMKVEKQDLENKEKLKEIAHYKEIAFQQEKKLKNLQELNIEIDKLNKAA
jgi:hypothetical protein